MELPDAPLLNIRSAAVRFLKIDVDQYYELCYSIAMKEGKSIHDQRELAKVTPEPNEEDIVICKYCNIELEEGEIRVFGDCCEMCNEIEEGVCQQNSGTR